MSKLVTILIIIIILLTLMLLVSLVGAAPIAFVNKWTNALATTSNFINTVVATNQGDSIAVFMDGLSCDTAAGMNYTITDNAAPPNVYTWIAERKSANCGTVDNQEHAWISLTNRPTTQVSITRQLGTGGTTQNVGILIQSYSNVVSLGNIASSTPNTAFPDMFITASTNISWAVGFIHFFSNPTPFPPGGYNAGRFVSSVATPATNLQNLGMDNNVTDNGTNGGNAHVCTITQICIFPNLGNAVSMYYIIFELIPAINPSVITLPASNIAMDAATLNGNLTDIGVGPTINVRFFWGDNISSLGNQTSQQSFSAPTTFNAFINQLASNHTYYFYAHAENAANASQFSNGVTLNFTTAPNVTAIQFGNYGWTFGFIGALILGLWGAYWVKKKRDEH